VQERGLFVAAPCGVGIARATNEIRGLWVTGRLRGASGDLLEELTAARREVSKSADQGCHEGEG
jgi:hypothetical protein